MLMFDLKMIKLSRLFHFMQRSEEIITSLIKKLVLRNQAKKKYHYKKTGAINLTGDEETK
jgi:hypothetical protein